jgi:hypothetical protein
MVDLLLLYSLASQTKNKIDKLSCCRFSGRQQLKGPKRLAQTAKLSSVERGKLLQMINQMINKQSPKGEPDGFEEIWKAKWSRGTAPNPRQPALKAYAGALKRGSPLAEILAGVKARVGVEKEDTPYAPQFVTWLNQRRWKDGTGAAVM